MLPFVRRLEKFRKNGKKRSTISNGKTREVLALNGFPLHPYTQIKMSGARKTMVL